MKVEVRNAYEMSAGKPERPNINLMCEDQSRLCSRAVQKCFSVAPLYTVVTLEYKTLPVPSVRKFSFGRSVK